METNWCCYQWQSCWKYSEASHYKQKNEKKLKRIDKANHWESTNTDGMYLILIFNEVLEILAV